MKLIEVTRTLFDSILRRRLYIKINGKFGRMPTVDSTAKMTAHLYVRSLIDAKIMCDEPFPYNYHACDDILNGVYELAGHIGVQVKDAEISENINWNKDPITMHTFPLLDDQNELLQIAASNGVDVKVLWDLGRMQVLPFLSIVYAQHRDERFLSEFIEQVESFTAQCGECTGIQWACTMDVAIRAANLLVAYDLFNQFDTPLHPKLSERFKSDFLELIYRHGLFIKDHLEVDLINGHNHNHYLTNICGLLYIASYLICDEADKWYAFSKKEFFREAYKQSLDDGTNFEASTSYHDYFGEALVYGAALIYRREQLPDRFIKLISSAANFSVDITKRSGERIQIGDNDSGHFFRLSTVYIYDESSGVTSENRLSSHNFLSAASGLISYAHTDGHKYWHSPEHKLVCALSNKPPVSAIKESFCSTISNIDLPKFDFTYRMVSHISFDDASINLTANGVWTEYPCFGLYCYKSSALNMYVYIGNNRIWPRSHAHHDILHFEFSTKDGDYFCDPGTGWYTVNSKWREYFRSERAHNAPCPLGYTHDDDKVFYAKPECTGKVIFLNESTICVSAAYSQATIYRTVNILCNEILITDESKFPFECTVAEPEYISKGYGFLSEHTAENGITVISEHINMNQGEENEH